MDHMQESAVREDRERVGNGGESLGITAQSSQDASGVGPGMKPGSSTLAGGLRGQGCS